MKQGKRHRIFQDSFRKMPRQPSYIVFPVKQLVVSGLQKSNSQKNQNQNRSYIIHNLLFFVN